MSVSNIARQFVSFYQQTGVTRLQSAPLVHPVFPMSFNMSAGLVQLDELLRSSTKIELQKMVVVQKCFRHFDINRVTDFSHLSFFEMGGYFEVGKFDRLSLMRKMFTLLTEVYKINPQRLWVSVFGGDELFGYHFEQDRAMAELWQSLLPHPDQVRYFDHTQSFWTQGGGAELAVASKLCGMETEVFYDLTGQPCSVGCLPNCNCGRFMEISNNLFITHQIMNDLSIKPLLNQAVESVIGIERVAAVAEQCLCVTDTSDFQRLRQLLPDSASQQSLSRCNRIIDHVRALCFLISDGAPDPGRNGRARILRTMMRQLLTDFYCLDLAIEETLTTLIQAIIKMYASRYPELEGKKTLIAQKICLHAQVYWSTLIKTGASINRLKAKNKTTVLTAAEQEYFRHRGIPLELQDKFSNLAFLLDK
jgi:alanyl-tRNA synthetase